MLKFRDVLFSIYVPREGLVTAEYAETKTMLMDCVVQIEPTKREDGFDWSRPIIITPGSATIKKIKFIADSLVEFGSPGCYWEIVVSIPDTYKEICDLRERNREEARQRLEGKV